MLLEQRRPFRVSQSLGLDGLGETLRNAEVGRCEGVGLRRFGLAGFGWEVSGRFLLARCPVLGFLVFDLFAHCVEQVESLIVGG